MDCVENYIKNLSSLRQDRFWLVTNYMRKNFHNLKETCEFSPKCNFPVWIDEITNMYFAIASMKQYISVYFSKRECIQMVLEECSTAKSGATCIKIKDSQEFPIESIKKAIDFCFEK